MGVQNPTLRSCGSRCGEVMGENWISETLFIQRDLSQNFFCEISNLLALKVRQSVQCGKRENAAPRCSLQWSCVRRQWEISAECSVARDLPINPVSRKGISSATV